MPAVFAVDPRAGSGDHLLPLRRGRNFDELLHVITALRTADHFAVATHAAWRPGELVIVPTAGSLCGTAKGAHGGPRQGRQVRRPVLLHAEVAAT